MKEKKMRLRFDFEGCPIMRAELNDEKELDEAFTGLKLKLFGRKK